MAQIVRTQQELSGIHPDTIVAYLPHPEASVHVLLAKQVLPQHDLPVIVIDTGTQVQTAQKVLRLEEAKR